MSIMQLIANAPEGATHYKSPIGYYHEVGGCWHVWIPRKGRWEPSAHAGTPTHMTPLRHDDALIRDEDSHEALTFGPAPGKGRAGGLKFDADKPRMELLIQGMPRALEAVGAVLTFGAEKYAAHSWKHVEDNENRYWAAKSRHELARAKGEARDPETGLLHLAHEACNALFLLELAMVAEELEQ